jgi:hypothetical protein
MKTNKVGKKSKVLFLQTVKQAAYADAEYTQKKHSFKKPLLFLQINKQSSN